MQTGRFNISVVRGAKHIAMSSMITTTAWVPRGFAAPFPAKYDFDEAEFERIADLAKLQLDDANEDLEEAQEEQDGGATLAEDGTDETASKGAATGGKKGKAA